MSILESLRKNYEHSKAQRFQLPADAERQIDPESASAVVLLSDFLDVEFWAQPAAVASLLPNGLEPDPAANGHCNALFYDWQFSGANEEYLDPARYQYREFFILVDALFEGRSVSSCPYIFVDNDAALARGWTQGYPKRLGQVFQTRYYAATSKAGPALAPGSKFAGSLTSAGQLIAEAVVTLKQAVTDPSLLKQKPVINLLHVPRLAAGKLTSTGN